jgi:L,D-transpeptidase YcbB
MLTKKYFIRRCGLFAAPFLFFLHLGCRYPVAQTSMPIDHQQPVMTEMLSMPFDSLDSVYYDLKEARYVFHFYSKGGYKPVWTNSVQMNESGDSLITFINNVRYHGLNPMDYHGYEINSIRNASISDRRVLRLDALLTDAFFCLSGDVKYGRSESGVKADSFSYQALLASGGITKYFQTLEPHFIGYRKLKSALKFKIDSLQNLYPLATVQNLIDISLPFFSEVLTIELNMERWRLERKLFGDHYILINIPSYTLYVIKNDSIVLESKVIVGKPETPTPMLSSSIDAIITYPYWYVPRKISVTEYLPAIQVDTAFLRQNNFEVLSRKGKLLDPDSIPWGDFNENYFPVVLRQREGTDNSLGILKFVFDNPYAVYLHDTNGKRLFRKDERAFSHGCIRLEKAVELAHYLATGKLGKKSRLVEKYLNEQERHTIALHEPIPIYVRYFTAEVHNASLYQYNDIYELDKLLFDQISPRQMDGF